MPRKKSEIKTIAVYFRAPEGLMTDFERIAKFAHFSKHEALRTAIRDFIASYTPEKVNMIEQLNALREWTKDLEKIPPKESPA